MGRQLFEKEGLYLHKRPWKREKNTYRREDRMREIEIERKKERESEG